MTHARCYPHQPPHHAPMPAYCSWGRAILGKGSRHCVERVSFSRFLLFSALASPLRFGSGALRPSLGMVFDENKFHPNHLTIHKENILLVVSCFRSARTEIHSLLCEATHCASHQQHRWWSVAMVVTFLSTAAASRLYLRPSE